MLEHFVCVEIVNGRIACAALRARAFLTDVLLLNLNFLKGLFQFSLLEVVSPVFVQNIGALTRKPKVFSAQAVARLDRPYAIQIITVVLPHGRDWSVLSVAHRSVLLGGKVGLVIMGCLQLADCFFD